MSLVVRGRVLRALLALPLLALPVSAHASGFAIESQGARAMGFAGAYVAQAADPSAIYYNAAGIGFLKGKQLYVGAAFASLSTDFTGSGPYPASGTLESPLIWTGVDGPASSIGWVPLSQMLRTRPWAAPHST